jgi:uncharacterized protein (TIGR02594 family)
MRSIKGSVGKGGKNLPDDVLVVQKLLNLNLNLLIPYAPCAENGIIDPQTIAMIEEYQRRVLKVAKPDGRVDPGGRTFKALLPPPGTEAELKEAPWAKIARAEIGTREIRGSKHNPRIVEYIKTFDYLPQNDEVAWCACFVNWCLIQAGKKAGPNALAASWLGYGKKLEEPKFGCIVVVYHAPIEGVTATGNHVAFWTEGDGRSITLLGGNQTAADRKTEEVNEKSSRGFWTVKGYRWPE